MKTSTLFSANFTEGNILLKNAPNDQQQNKITYSRSVYA